jgi:ATP-dependent helicase HepA
MKFQPGQRVKYRTSGEIGTVVGTTPYKPLRYKVAFQRGTWEVPPSDLAAVFDDPFEVLISRPDEMVPYDAWLRREGLRLLDAYRNDPTAALSNSRVEPKPHQVSVAMRALAKPQPRLILADEVGLGKTIEAGLILKELRARGVLNRVLILAPASLVTQWQQELRSKFNEVFINHDGAMLRDLRERHPAANPWNVSEQANVITSMQYARLDGQRQHIAEADWDLVIVDEAHHARRRQTEGSNLAYDLLEELRDRIGGLLLLTATPMQLERYELYSMVELVEPGLFEDYHEFEAAQADVALINEQISWLKLGTAPAMTNKDELEALFDSWKAPADVRGADLSKIEGRTTVAGWLEGCHLLSEAMVRNRKAEVAEGFMRRRAHRLPVIPTEEELKLERDVQAYLRREYAHSPAFGLVLVTFQKLLASSSRALGQALERRSQRILREQAEEETELTDDPELREELDELLSAGLAREAEALELHDLAERAFRIRDTKLDVLEAELDALFAEHPDQKVLIFTQYLGTIETIRERLAPKLRVGVFHGEMDRREKDAAYSAFKAQLQVLISSEAGGEGRNFQFCHILFNYDLPWNPMRVEQRIGRLDRVGQKHNVLIYNFGVRDTLDERILDVLENRIRIFEQSVGALEPILGDIEERIKRICLSDAQAATEEFDKYEVELEERIRRALESDEHMRDFVMDARSFRRDEVSELLSREPMARPQDLEHFVFAALRRYPAGEIEELREGVYRITPPGVLIRANPRLHDRESFTGTFNFRVALDDETLDFFAFGHPLVDAVVAAVTDDGVVLPVGAATHSEEGVLVDYEVEFVGVRERRELLSHVVDRRGVGNPPELSLDGIARGSIPIPELSDNELMNLVERSRAAAEQEQERRFQEFGVENQFNYEAELRRLEKLVAFQRRHFESRVDQNLNQIRELEMWGTEQQRGIIPALRGRIARDTERIQQVDEDHEARLRDLVQRREPSQRIRALGVTFLMARAPGSADTPREGVTAGH